MRPALAPGLIAVDVTQEMWEQFDKVAAERGLSRQELLAEFVADGMRKHGRGAPPPGAARLSQTHPAKIEI